MWLLSQKLCRQLNEVEKIYFRLSFINKEILSFLAPKHIVKPSTAFFRSSHMHWMLNSQKVDFIFDISIFFLEVRDEKKRRISSFFSHRWP